MIDIEKLKPLIIEKLRPLNIKQIILFGSYAYGKPNEDSDVDLYVVTNDDFIPQNFKEKNQLYLKVSKQLRDLRKFIAIDLIVHSTKMNQLFKENNSSFYRNDIQNGIKLI
ncbi:MAG: nucleotidyltransferase domain-containing protein [Helicobacteraceae bacterium]|nr:nucleotidyltransferase domain-containing protein [Helicobacteraceae bacterium]